MTIVADCDFKTTKQTKREELKYNTNLHHTFQVKLLSQLWHKVSDVYRDRPTSDGLPVLDV